jgi:glutamate-1-semialdehyde 2,1-aminomutase
MTIDEEYVASRPRSRELFERQRRLVPGGFTHTARVLEPFPLFVSANRGARKRDVDGHEYVDHWLGHGAMLLGHAHPDVVAAVVRQSEYGWHGGGETEIALEWAELIRQLVPSAESVRFVASGGEATQMALRVARAFTGRDRILKFQGAFHGWHDAVTIGAAAPYGAVPGVPAAVAETVVAVPFADLALVERALEAAPDVAAILVEPGGLFDDTVPSDPGYLRGLRELATAHGALLVFDEVVSGFRHARGGAQEAFGVLPDLTTLGKVMGGGLSVGALVGRSDVMEVLAGRVPHPGTWNANPAAAAAGVATLRLVRDTDAVAAAARQTRRIVEGIDAAFEGAGVQGFAYGRGSLFKTCLGPRPALLAGDLSNREADVAQLLEGWGARTPAVRKAMLLEGVDLMRKDGFVSSVHSDEDVELTCRAFERALARMKREGCL